MSDLECPYCEKDCEVCHDDGFGYEEGKKHQMECPHCGKSFVFETSISFYYEGDDLAKNRISFDIFNQEIFGKYLSQLKKSDFKIVSSKTEKNITLEYYKNETTTIEVKTRFVENHFGKQRTFYSFYITDNNYTQTKYY